jgi:hypothetical protein
MAVGQIAALRHYDELSPTLLKVDLGRSWQILNISKQVFYYFCRGAAKIS